MDEQTKRYQQICQQIENTCLRLNRDPKSVTLLAVSKFQPVSLIETLYQQGHHSFAENYAQEFSEKAHQVNSSLSNIQWHFIGFLQRNKIKFVAGKICLLHTMDRISLLEAYSSYLKNHGLPPQDCLVEVNLAGETQKSGCSEKDLPQLLDAFEKEEGRLRCKGLMCIPPVHADPEYSRSFFRRLKDLQEQLKNQPRPHVSLQELSMGMSSDFQIAIEEGATMIRIGTALFGSRPT